MFHGMTTVSRRAFVAIALACGLATAAQAAGPVPATPESGTFRLGIEPWLGYGLWHVAKAKNMFAKHGLADVELVNFTEDKDINAALASGQLDGANIATHTAMAMAAAGLPVKIVMLLDVSMSADAIIAGNGIGSVNDLKGKQIAYEEGTTSDILLNYALRANGMTLADVQPVPMPAADAGSALIAGRVPAAVTYEPYLTVARNQDKTVKLLFTAGKDPGLVSDVLVVRDSVADSKPGPHGGIVLTRDLDAAIGFVNAYAPEHLEILAAEPMALLGRIDNAGEILLGPHTPVTIANFVLGPNAVLPTGSAARVASPLSVFDYMKRSSVGHVTAAGYAALATRARTLAHYEGFDGHARA